MRIGKTVDYVSGMMCAAVCVAALWPVHRAVADGPTDKAAGLDDNSVMDFVEPESVPEDAIDWREYKDAAPVSLGEAPEGFRAGVERGRKSIFVYMAQELRRDAAQRGNVKQFAANRGGSVKYEYTTVLPNVLNIRNLTPADIEAIKKMDGVVKVEEDMYHYYVLNLDEATPRVRALQSQISGAGLSADGTGVRVCVCDTGIDMDHVMYTSRIDTSASFDFVNNDNNPDDDQGHGSHVAGIAVGGTGLTVDLGCDGVEPFQGTAPNATLIGSKILNSAGGGIDSDIIAGIDHCADQSPSGGRADVINLSIGTGNFSGICTHSWAVASNNAVAAGVVVIAASGNENNANSMGSPACGVNVIAVGATYKTGYPNCEDGTSTFNWGSCSDSSPAADDIVCFSNQSDFLDVSAPGSVILSASNAAGGGSTTSQSGTSMASPAVAGLAALVLDADGSLTPAEVRQILRDGATDMGSAGFDRAYGYGRIDVINTLNLVVPCGIDPDCDDGLFCNGAETCNAGSCQPGADPCPGQSCDEAGNTCVAGPSVVYAWNMDANPGWTTQGQWAWGSPSGGGGQYGGPDPTSGATGSNVMGYNLAGDYANNLPETHLTTTAIDCTNLIGVSVRFERWLGVEQPAYDRAYLRVSNNGSTWTTIWENTTEVGDTSWSLLTYDISSVADGQSTVFLRWTIGITDGSWQYCGWNIDDVEIVATDLGGGGTCSDGIQNQGETRIDCGGPCAACDCTSNAACDDGLFCNGSETCDTFGFCQNAAPVNCNDGVGCTDDSCNEATNSCDNVANNANCDNGLFCDGSETCSATLDCQAGTAVNCNDGVGCTDDSCNEVTDSCDNVANDANCDNGLFCDGSETCSATLDCQSGSAVNCDDGVGCTDDSCNEATNSCNSVANNANCDNGVFCDGAETCSATLDCQTGTTVNCDDGIGCTADACNEGTNACDNTPDNTACDDGLFCNGAETCSGVSDCIAGSDPCPGQTCDEATNACSGGGGCITNPDCDDLNACTVDTCSAGVCSNVCASSVSSFPYAENFESGLGLWSNVSGDVFDWTRRSGSTPSSNTGPSGDNTTGSGFYVYTETSSPRAPGDTAILEGPCLDLSGESSATLTFWYSMFGSSMGTLDVEVSTDCASWTNVFTISGDQGTAWIESNIDLASYVGSSSVKVRFRGIRGSSWRGDIAVDDISVTTSAAANCVINADCDDGNPCTDDACIASNCQNTNNTAACDDGVFCNGNDVCNAGACAPIVADGVANGTFDGGGSWTSAPGGGSITYPGNLNVVGTNAGSGGFSLSSQGNVTVNGANLEFDLLSYSGSDSGDWDYPVFYLNGTYYGLNSNGTLGAATTGGTGGGGSVDNAGQVGSAIRYVVNIDALAGNSGPHTVGFGVHSVDGGFGAGTAVYDTVLPAGGPIDPCPGQTCDEVGDVCVP